MTAVGITYSIIYGCFPNRRVDRLSGGQFVNSVKDLTGYMLSLDDARGLFPWVAREVKPDSRQ